MLIKQNKTKTSEFTKTFGNIVLSHTLLVSFTLITSSMLNLQLLW